MAYVDKLKNGSSLTYHPTDVTDQSRISSLVIDQIAREEGRLDLCVAAAGILGPAEGESCLKYSKKDWERVMKVNLDGVFYTCQAAARGMVETGCKAGSIVMIASMSGSITNKVGTGPPQGRQFIC
jgi:NAD(P)-dependent dehydrogenase (short-subunit alcohol dehydrogenase family)